VNLPYQRQKSKDRKNADEELNNKGQRNTARVGAGLASGNDFRYASW
jgi:hypothetical protein